MRSGGYPRQRTSVLIWLIAGLLSAYILQSILVHWFRRPDVLPDLLALSVPALQAGQVWKLLTYGLLHSQFTLLHVAANVLALYFLGREVLPLLGSRRFVMVFAAAVVAGGLAWSGTHWIEGTSVELVGASAGIASLLVIFAYAFPNQPITFLLFFLFPITVRPKMLAIGVACFEALGFLLYELPGGPSPFSIAFSAHLGGMAAGWIYMRHLHEAGWARRKRGTSIELPAWLKKARRQKSVAAPVYQVDVTPRPDLRSEVDRILDKINSKGFSALTPEEKKLLDEARDLLSRR